MIILQLIFFDLTKISTAIQQKFTIFLDSRSIKNTKQNLSFPLKETTHSFLSFLLIVIPLNILLLAWVFRIECYPFTTWQMFATTNHSGEITYYRTIIHDQSSTVSRINFKDIFGSSVYRYHVRNCFNPKKIQICQKFLDASALNYQEKASPEKTFKQFEIQKWQWNFKFYPQDPQHGEIIARFIYPN